MRCAALEWSISDAFLLVARVSYSRGACFLCFSACFGLFRAVESTACLLFDMLCDSLVKGFPKRMVSSCMLLGAFFPIVYGVEDGYDTSELFSINENVLFVCKDGIGWYYQLDGCSSLARRAAQSRCPWKVRKHEKWLLVLCCERKKRSLQLCGQVQVQCLWIFALVWRQGKRPLPSKLTKHGGHVNGSAIFTVAGNGISAGSQQQFHTLHGA